MSKSAKYDIPVLSAIFQTTGMHDKMARAWIVPAVTDKKLILNKLLKHIEEGNQNRSRNNGISLSPAFRIAISTAASLVLILLLHFLLSVVRLENESQQVKAIRLPDQSRVVLNKNSSVSYARYWWKREIKLKGDAYFEVEKGKTFIVKTKEGDVCVLGTRFQVSERSNGLVINCYEGKVSLSDEEHVQEITAGHSLEYEDNGAAALNPLLSKYPEMAQFKRNFKGEKLSAVTTALENFFHIKILLETEHSERFTGNLETADAETALRIICRSMNLNYAFNSNRNIIINEK